MKPAPHPVSLPSFATIVSLPSSPESKLASELPFRTLATVLPVPSMAAEPDSVRFSMFEASAMLTVEEPDPSLHRHFPPGCQMHRPRHIRRCRGLRPGCRSPRRHRVCRCRCRRRWYRCRPNRKGCSNHCCRSGCSHHIARPENAGGSGQGQSLDIVSEREGHCGLN